MSGQNRDANIPMPGGRNDKPIYSADGVDLTLIRWMLSLTLTERLEFLQEHIRSIMELRGVEYETLADERDRMK
jgi:hypothetical protein